MNKLTKRLSLALVLMMGVVFSSAFATGFNDDVSVSEPSQFIVDVGSGEVTMLITKSNTVSIGAKFAEGTDGYFATTDMNGCDANLNGLKRLSG